MSTKRLKIAFFTEDDRICRKRDQFGPSRMIEHVILDVIYTGAGHVAVMVPFKVFALMGEGPFKIFLAAARMGATISWSEVGDSMPPLVTRFFDMLDQRLGEGEYVAGERFSVADITALVAVDFSRIIKMGLENSHRNARRWHEQVSARPGVVK